MRVFVTGATGLCTFSIAPGVAPDVVELKKQHDASTTGSRAMLMSLADASSLTTSRRWRACCGITSRPAICGAHCQMSGLPLPTVGTPQGPSTEQSQLSSQTQTAAVHRPPCEPWRG